jgi:hypothetical protein
MSNRQVTIRQLLGFTFLIAVLIGLLRLWWTNTSYRLYSMLIVVIPILLSYCCYTTGSVVSQLFPALGKARRILLPLDFLVATVTGYVLWARSRVANADFAFDPSYPRAFPFPDKLLEAYHDYLDVTHPANGFIKMHAEYPLLMWHVDILSLLCIAMTAIVVGIAIPKPSWQPLLSHLKLKLRNSKMDGRQVK